MSAVVACSRLVGAAPLNPSEVPIAEYLRSQAFEDHDDNYRVPKQIATTLTLDCVLVVNEMREVVLRVYGNTTWETTIALPAVFSNMQRKWGWQRPSSSSDGSSFGGPYVSACKNLLAENMKTSAPAELRRKHAPRAATSRQKDSEDLDPEPGRAFDGNQLLANL